MTKQSGLQSRKQRYPLFAQRGQIASDARKTACPLQRAKATRDLLLDLDHTDISFCLRVVKRHSEVGQEGQHRFLSHVQSIQQIEGSALLASPPRGRRGRTSLQIGLI